MKRSHDAHSVSTTGRISCFLWPQRSLLCVGTHKSSGYKLLELNLWKLQGAYMTVEAGPINNAMEDIPAQTDAWSCGINSAGRFMAMVGHPYADFKSFHHHSPNHPAGHRETGPGTQRLAQYMTQNHETAGLFVGPNMTDDWASQRDLISRSLTLSRPAMVLVEVSSRNLHWVNIIGRGRYEPHNYIILDTDGFIHEYSGGEDALRARMDLKDHIVHSIPLRNDRVARFNSITATNGELPPERCCRRNMANGHASLRGNRSAVHNITNTVLDSPIVLATPLAPIATLWRLF